MNQKVRQPSSWFRGPLATGLAEASADAPQIDREGGDHGAGIIRGFAMITRGEALGHELWIDADFLQQTVDAMNADPGGIKARFTHPGLSGDGLGTFLGRAKNASLDGDVVRADLHFSPAAHNTPDGDLADYVMTLAEVDPAAFGASIVFDHDRDAERAFLREHVVKGEGFISPDPDNTENFEHARLSRLRAVDAVDQPAANPNGWFHRGQELPAEGESLLSYSLGLTQERPTLSALDIDPDRVHGFVERFLDRHGLSVVPKTQQEQEPMAGTKPQQQQTETPQQPTRDEFNAELKRFTEAFGANGATWFADGKSFEEACQLHAAQLAEDLKKKDEEIAALNDRIASLDKGEEEAVEFQDGEKPAGDKKAAELSLKLGDKLGRFAAGIQIPSRN